MVQRCVVVGCKNGYKSQKVKSQDTGDKENKVSFFRVPRSEDDRKEWIRRIKRDGWIPTENSRVCSDHFEPHLIQTERTSDRAKKEKGTNRTYLKPKEGAVPTLKLGHNDPSAAFISPRRTQGAKLNIRDQAKELKFAEDQKKKAELKAKRNEVTELNHLYAFLEKSPRPRLVILPGPNGELNILRHLLSPPRVVSSLEVQPNLRFKLSVKENLVSCRVLSGGLEEFKCLLDKLEMAAAESQEPEAVSEGTTTEEAEDAEAAAALPAEEVDEAAAAWARLEALQKEAELTADALHRLCTSEEGVVSGRPSEEGAANGRAAEEGAANGRAAEHAAEAALKVRFAAEQLKLAKYQSANGRRYGDTVLKVAMLLYLSSPSAYRRVRKVHSLTLPSERTFQRFMTLVNANPDRYHSVRVGEIENDLEKNVMLIFDEVKVAEKMELDGSRGEILGVTSAGQVAKHLMTIMISSIGGKYREVIKMIPTGGNLKAEDIKHMVMVAMEMVHKIGLNLVAICCDNLASQSSALLNMITNSEESSFINPYSKDSPVFVIIDPTHNLKNVFNQFLKKKFKFPAIPAPRDDMEPIIPSTSTSADFDHIKALVSLERAKGLQMAPQLTKDTLNPLPIQRTQFCWFLKTFHEKTIEALKIFSATMPCREVYLETAGFLSVFNELYKILSVRHPKQSKRHRDPRTKVLESGDDRQLIRLGLILQWIESWEEQGCLIKCPEKRNCSCLLSKETFRAFKISLRGIIGLSKHCFSSLNFQYLLLGKVNSDILERFFSWL